MTRFCAGEDSWLARSNNMTKSPGNSDTKDSSGRSRRNKQKRHINSDNAEDMAVNVRFRGSKPGQRKNHSKEILRARPVWTEYSIAPARYMAPKANHPIIPTEIVGFSNRPAN